MVLCTSGAYRYGISEKILVGKKGICPDSGKETPEILSCVFSYTEEVTLTKTPVKEQIICSVDLGINTDAVCTIMRADGTVLGRRFIDHPSEKRPDVPHTGTDPQIPEGTWLCADTGKMGIYETSEHRTGKKDCRCDCKICGRKPCRCDRVRVSGDAGEDIGKEKNRNCTCGEKGISKDAVNIRHTGKGCGYPGSVHGIPADWLMMVPGGNT